MIRLLIGENTFEIERELKRIIDAFEGEVEKLDASNLKSNILAEALTCVNLFSASRLVVIRGLSENSDCWNKICDFLPNIADGVDLVMIETKPDKRTNVFKKLKEIAEIKEFIPWSERDVAKAESWVVVEVKARGIAMDKKSIQALINRVGIDQWALNDALVKLSLLDEISPKVIEDVIEANPNENVFSILELALSGDIIKLKKVLSTLEKTEDVYKLVSLISSQTFQLAAVSAAGSEDDVAKDFAVHPYVLSKLKTLYKKIGKTGVAQLVDAMAKLDENLKTTGADPWFLVKQTLIKLTATIS